MGIKRESGYRTLSTSVWHRKRSVDVIGDDDDDGDAWDDSADHVDVDEGKEGSWTFPEICWKISKASGSERDLIRFAF